MKRETFRLGRRAFLGTGGLVVAFSLARPGWAQEQPVPGPSVDDLPGDLPDAPYLDAWIRIAPDGEITVFTGKVELGQGAKTALTMVAAEELLVPPDQIALVTADTGQTPDEGYTAGSQTMSNSGTAIRVAAANVRQLLTDEAARQLGVGAAGLSIADKTISAGDRSLGYGELAAALDLHVVALADVPLIRHQDLAVMGSDMQRVDIPAKLTGGQAYVHDWRADGMVHARVIRPPSPGAVLEAVDDAEVAAMPGVLAVIRDGSFLAVVAEQEYQAVLAMRALTTRVTWTETASLPDRARLNEALRALESEVGTVAEGGSPDIPDGDRTLRATFSRPYLMHASMGPSCAVAQFSGGKLTVWSHTQGVFPDRTAIAEMLGMDEADLRVIHVEGAGCYGHNGADDAAGDAALIASKFPDRPVRLQWMREQEHGWEPYGPAMVMDIAGTVGEDGRISHWNYDLWSNSHSTRPGGAGNLLAGQYKANGAGLELPGLRITSSGNGDRNAIPYYTIPNHRERWHFIHDMALRVSALRGLGAHANVFAIEGFMDELALLAETDPVEFRLRHLDDPRARDVVQRVVDEGGWSTEQLPPNVGRGFAFARYKNHAAYFAVSVTAEVSPETGRVQVRDVVCAIDSGEVVSPDGIRNQTEGGICQSLSWSLYEEVTFDTMRTTSIDWSSYPILRFASVPDTVAVHIMDRPDEPFLGTGEAAQGPAAAAIGNAIRNAIGVRLHDLPMTRERIMAARTI